MFIKNSLIYLNPVILSIFTLIVACGSENILVGERVIKVNDTSSEVENKEELNTTIDEEGRSNGTNDAENEIASKTLIVSMDYINTEVKNIITFAPTDGTTTNIANSRFGESTKDQYKFDITLTNSLTNEKKVEWSNKTSTDLGFSAGNYGFSFVNITEGKYSLEIKAYHSNMPSVVRYEGNTNDIEITSTSDSTVQVVIKMKEIISEELVKKLREVNISSTLKFSTAPIISKIYAIQDCILSTKRIRFLIRSFTICDVNINNEQLSLKINKTDLPCTFYQPSGAKCASATTVNYTYIDSETTIEVTNGSSISNAKLNFDNNSLYSEFCPGS